MTLCRRGKPRFFLYYIVQIYFSVFEEGNVAHPSDLNRRQFINIDRKRNFYRVGYDTVSFYMKKKHFTQIVFFKILYSVIIEEYSKD